jgi:hypothetical protein
MLPTFGSDSTGYYFEDAQLVNALNELDTSFAVTNATNASPIVVTLSPNGTFPFNIGDKVVCQSVLGNTAANGGFTVSAIDATNWKVTLSGSTGSGAYVSGGTLAKQIQGLVPDSEGGLVAFVIAGTGRGTQVKIASNTQTRYYISGNWPVAPDSTTRIIVLSGSYTTDIFSPNINNSLLAASAQHDVDIINYGRQTIFVSVGTASSNSSNVSPVTFDPYREIFLFGSVGSTTTLSDGYFPLATVSGHVDIDLVNGVNQALEPMTADIIVNSPFLSSGGSMPLGQRLSIKMVQPALGTAYAPDFITCGAFLGMTNQDIDLTLNTYSIWDFKYNGSKFEYQGGVRGIVNS